MARKGIWIRAAMLFVVLSLLMSFSSIEFTAAQGVGPQMLDPRLDVRTLTTGLITPTTIAFLSSNQLFVLEKNTGKVQYIVNGVIDHTALDLAVNNNSERGLLGIALDPAFNTNHAVYLYWSCIAPAPTGDLFTPTQTACDDTSQLGADSGDMLAVPLLGNRVDRLFGMGRI